MSYSIAMCGAFFMMLLAFKGLANENRCKCGENECLNERNQDLDKINK